MLNPELDPLALGREFDCDQRLRINNLLEEPFAREVHNQLQSQLLFDNILFSQNRNIVLSDQELQGMAAAQREQLQGELLSLANRGIGFFYSGYRMESERITSAPAALQDLFELVRGGAMLDFVKEISGYSDLTGADGQFTRFSRGQYLTRHSDFVPEERRRLAYVVNFTPNWHPDWGGLLQFYHDNGIPRDAWEPRFNCLSLFDVRHVHAVTFVAPFAGAARYALTGWFHN